MKDARKVHKLVKVYDRFAECRLDVGWLRDKFQWSIRWSDVTCTRCLKHRPKKRKVSNGK